MIKFPHAPLLLFVLAACGQAPSFVERNGSSSDDARSGGSVEDTGARAPGDEGDVVLPGEGANEWSPDWAQGEGAADGDENPEGVPTLPEIPAADADDLPALHKCLSKWKNHPFKGTVDNYQHISASISVGGIGNVVNDDERTEEPFLVLIDAAVNVGGTPTYNLMNPNGYYCMKVNVNVLTSLNVNLHCNARLADEKVNVNVGSNQNDTTSTVGVHVLSEVQVTTVRPEGDSCIR